MAGARSCTGVAQVAGGSGQNSDPVRLACQARVRGDKAAKHLRVKVVDHTKEDRPVVNIKVPSLWSSGG